MRGSAAALALLLTVAGCRCTAMAADPAARAAEDASTPDANLFVYRDAARPTACAAELYLDGKLFASLPQHSYTSLAVRPGQHQLEFRWSSELAGPRRRHRSAPDRRPPASAYFALTGDAQLSRDPLEPRLRHQPPRNHHTHTRGSRRGRAGGGGVLPLHAGLRAVLSGPQSG